MPSTDDPIRSQRDFYAFVSTEAQEHSRKRSSRLPTQARSKTYMPRVRHGLRAARAAAGSSPERTLMDTDQVARLATLRKSLKTPNWSGANTLKIEEPDAPFIGAAAPPPHAQEATRRERCVMIQQLVQRIMDGSEASR